MKRKKLWRRAAFLIALIWGASLCVVLFWSGLLPGGSDRSRPFPKWTLVALEIDLSKLRYGSTISEVQSAFGVPGAHQFTIVRESVEYLCLNYPIGIRFGYYAIFVNGGLKSIIEKPPPSGYVDEQGNWLAIPRKWKTADRIDAVFETKSMLGPNLLGSVRRRFREKESLLDSNLTHLVALFAPIFVPATIQGAFQDRQIERNSEKLARIYDHSRINLGMPLAEVVARLGKPELTRLGRAGKILHRYGCPEMDEIWIWRRGHYKISRIVVEFEKDVVTRVFSNDFVNESDFPIMDN